MDLTYICKHKLLTKLWESLPSHCSGWKMLVIDKPSLKTISTFCGMDDLLNADCLDVIPLEKVRQPLMCPALYLIAPNAESVELVCQDFADKQHPMYSSAVVVCTGAIDPELFEKLSKIDRIYSKPTEDDDRKKNIFVIPLDFHVAEQRVFTLNDPNAFYHLYSPHSSEEKRNEIIEKIGDSIASFLMCLKINAVIRYVDGVEGALAQRVKDAVHQGYIKLSGSPLIDQGNLGDKSTRHLNLLICDRISDVISPLMTEFTVQSMVYDCMPVVRDTLKVQCPDGEKVAVLDDNDLFWKQLRHKHIATSAIFISEEITAFSAAHKEMKNMKAAAKDIKKMQEMMKQLPEYMDIMTKFNIHMKINDDLMSIQEKLKLTEFAVGEQALGTGKEADGKAIKRPMAYIQSSVGNISFEQDRRLREALIFLLSQDYTDADKNALVNLLKGNEVNKQVIDAAMLLPKTKREQLKSKKVLADLNFEYDTSRYHTLIKEIIVRLSHNDIPSNCVLDEIMFNNFQTEIEPTQGNITVAAGKTLKKQKGKEKEGLADAGKKVKLTEKDLLGTESNILVVFVTGAISYSEMRTVYELSEKLKMNIFIGSNYIVNQNKFVKMIKSLGNTEFVDITMDMQDSNLFKEKK